MIVGLPTLRPVIGLWILYMSSFDVATAAASSSKDQQQHPNDVDVCDSMETAAMNDGSTTTTSSSCRSTCHHDSNRCHVPSTIYESSRSSGTYIGKTAMAYVPNWSARPQSLTSRNFVCDTTNEHLKALPYRVATWPLSRSTRRKPKRSKISNSSVAPTLQVKLNFFTCQESQSLSDQSSDSVSSSTSYWSYLFSFKKKTESTKNSDSSKNKRCCCQPYHNVDEHMEIDIWQTRPDGTYPSLRSAYREGNKECRARYIITPTPQYDHEKPKSSNSHNNSSMSSATTSLVFHTLAPGSTGAWNGLGPQRWDIPPYGPPVVHMMIHSTVPTINDAAAGIAITTTATTTTTFIDLPILVTPTTYEWTKFRGADYRGPAWVATKSQHRNRQRHHNTKDNSSLFSGERYQILKWEPKREQNHIDIEIDLFLPPHHRSTTTTSGLPLNQHHVMCPSSYWYGFPTSFLVEPMAVCAPSLLDFFSI